jgi:hypothetical protein
VNGHRMHGVPRGGGEPAVEVEIERARIASLHGGGEPVIEHGAEVLDVAIGRTLRGEPRDFRLHDQPGFAEVRAGQPSESEQRGEIARHHARVDRANEMPAARSLTHLEQATVLERLQRLAHGDATGAEAASQLALRRKLVAAREPSIVDGTLDVGDDVMVHAWRPDGRKHGANVQPKKFEVKPLRPAREIVSAPDALSI